MAVSLDFLTKTLLDAPVGLVEHTVEEILKLPVQLNVIEQNLTTGTIYNRKIVISVGKVPIVRATARFDSKNLPNFVMRELLQKKKGIGNILREHNIIVQRNTLEINVEPGGKKLTRDYEILYNNVIWFKIIEEIRLDLLNTCQNR